MEDVLLRVLHNLFGRANGPAALRLVWQPIMAAILATRDGIRDAKQNRPPYGWALVKDPAHRKERLRDGWKSIRKVFFFALLVDVIYQLVELHWIYIGEALITSEMLALTPYVLLRGLANRIARVWLRRKGTSLPA